MTSKLRGFVRRPILAVLVGLALLGVFGSLAFADVIQGILTGPFGNTIDTRTEGQFLLGRQQAGAVTITASDNNSVADLTIDPGGAAALTLGSADVTSVTLLADTDVTVRNGATGSVTLDFRDYADTADDDMAHVIETVNCTDAATGTEDCDWTLGVVEAGAAAETRLNVDADGDITVGSANNGNVVTRGTGVQLRNSATGNVDLDFRDYADTADDDMAHTLLRTNCTDATTGAEDCDFTIGIVEAGAAAETRLAFDADGDNTIGSATSAAFISLGTSTSLRNSATGNVDLDFRDYADSADDDMAHALLSVNCTDATTGAEDCDFSVSVVEAGAAAQTRFIIDADNGITLGSANTNSFTVTTDGTGSAEVVLPLESIAGAEMVNDTVNGAQLADLITLDATTLDFANGSTGSVLLSLRDYADTADDDMAHTLFTTNCTDTLTGAEDCDFSIGVVEAGAAADTRFNIDADLGITLGSATTDSFTVTTDGTGTGEVVLPLQSIAGAEIVNDTIDGTELADTIAMDAAFAITGAFGITMGGATTTSFTVTTDGTGTGEVVLPLQSIAGAELVNDTVDGTELADTIAMDAAFAITGAFGITMGGATTTSFTVTTDGTGTGEVVLPLQSIAAGELVNDTVDGTELADTITLDAALVVTGAFSHNYGNNLATSVTIDTDGTGDAELVLPDASVSALEIVDATRAIPLPIGSWVPCAGTAPGIWDASGVDTEPDMGNVGSSIVIEYDDTAGSIDTDEICNAFTVPDDYVSGGSFQFRLSQDAATVTIEDWACRISVDTAAAGALTTVALVSQTAAQTISMTPAGTWAAGAAIGILCAQSDGAADDTVRLHGGHAEYVASQ